MGSKVGRVMRFMHVLGFKGFGGWDSSFKLKIVDC